MKLENVSKRYDDTIIFDHLCIAIDQPGLYVILGKSGIGKSTLMNIISGIEKIDVGIREVDNMRIAYSLQVHTLIKQLNVQEHLLLYSKLFQIEQEEYYDKVIQKLGLKPLLYHYPNELSKGQCQRVSVAITLLSNCEILLFDEPTEYLNKHYKEVVMDLIYEKSKKRIVIITSHEENVINYPHTTCVIENHNVNMKDIINNDYQFCSQTYQIVLTEFQRYLSKIENLYGIKFLRRCIMSTLIILICMQFFISLFFTTKEKYSFNADLYYVSDFKEEDLADLKEMQAVPQLELSYSNTNNVDFRIHSTPYIEEMKYMIPKLQFYGEQIPINQKLIVNRNLASLFHLKNEKDLIGKQILLSYGDEKQRYYIEFEISGVVYEDVKEEFQIYYDQRFVENKLKEVDYYDKSNYPNAYIIHKSKLIENYLQSHHNSHIKIKNIIEILNQKDKEVKSKYIFAFISMCIFLFLGVNVYLNFLNYQYQKNMKVEFAFLQMIVQDYAIMKKLIIRTWLKRWLLFIILMVLEVICFIFISQQNYSYFIYIMMLMLPFVYVILHAISILLLCSKLKIDKLAQILK